MSDLPKEGLTTKAKVVKVIDGDTIEVEVSRKFAIRLLDPNNHNNKKFGAAEIDTPEGVKAKEALSALVKDDEVIIFIPAKNSLNLMDINSFNRLLAEVWTLEGYNVSSVLKEKGYLHENQKAPQSTETN